MGVVSTAVVEVAVLGVVSMAALKVMEAAMGTMTVATKVAVWETVAVAVAVAVEAEGGEGVQVETSLRK